MKFISYFPQITKRQQVHTNIYCVDKSMWASVRACITDVLFFMHACCTLILLRHFVYTHYACVRVHMCLCLSAFYC